MGAGNSSAKLLFIVNPGSGNHQINYSEAITLHFKAESQEIEIFELPKDCSLENLKQTIDQSKADRVIAVGGDGTLKLVAECLAGTNIPIGIIPAGSANGMAKELGIPLELEAALKVAASGQLKKIHAIKVNGEFCIHLADIGFNAYIIKRFDHLPQRGMIGYAKAAWQALWSHHKMEVDLEIKGKQIQTQAAMVVIANATSYGTGVKINPEGDLTDDLFEVILVKKYTVLEILKVKFTELPFNREKIELFHTKDLCIKTRHKVHFQVDGEYQGKVNQVEARILPAAITIIIP
ncbi:diacylglycerol/lipid kinase family protein [Pedobacter gandavensis]|uniref:YegS/Rv2252/BmrU family lipid kinase n=1 Tax=Pedobacter gandavensis TaxID=2679963 RepID=A0ABR6EYQ9_9SPHI|nr:YegS/Rv2252/BmrU family lipid kinase [Pedobacter gandavensis]MBB2150311.1 YegS/Rv2252/BmrU family lipid kinase [Pedobacter gandavensis]